MKFVAAALLAPVLSAGVALGVPAAAHAGQDGLPDATAAYSLDHTSGYRLYNQSAQAFVADFKVTETAAQNVASRTITLGDGSAPVAWASGTTFTLRYVKNGTFNPIVTLTDLEGDTSTQELPTVRVLNDTVAPKVAISKPAKPTKASSWKVVRGTTSDVGQGVAGVIVFVMEKRGSYWYAYDFAKNKWIKGYTSATKTSNKSKAAPSIHYGPGTSWRSLPIKGLKKGTLRIEAAAVDYNENYGEARTVTQKVK